MRSTRFFILFSRVWNFSCCGISILRKQLLTKVFAVPFVKDQKDQSEEEKEPELALDAALEALTAVAGQKSPAVVVSPPSQTHRQKNQASDDDGSGPQDKSYLPQAVAKIMGEYWYTTANSLQKIIVEERNCFQICTEVVERSEAKRAGQNHGPK